MQDFFMYSIEVRMLELGLDINSENFERALHWACQQALEEMNDCKDKNVQIYRNDVRRIVSVAARSACSLFTN